MNPAGEPVDEAHVCVLIVGAGPVGLVLANLLGGAGVRVLMVERETTLSPIPRAVALDDEGMRVLQAAGLVERVSPDMLLGYDHHLFGRRGQLLLKVDPAGREFGFPKRNRFHQPDLERELLKGLERFPNVQVRFETQLTDLLIGETGSFARLEGGAGPATISAQWVVGCDGGQSAVRRLLGIAMAGESHPEPWIVVDTENNKDTARFSRAIGDPRRPNVNVPGAGGRRRYEFMLLPGEDAETAGSDENVRQLLAPWCDLEEVRVVRRAVYTFHSLLAERFSHGRRVFLAGDAAHMMPPFQGQGMNSGIRDAANLAWKLAAVQRGQAGEQLLDSYEKERRTHAAEMIALSKRVGSILMTRDPLRAWLRDLMFAVLSRTPISGQYLREMRFKPRPQAARGFFLASRHSPLPGRLFVQPDVLDRTGRRRRLDEMLGPGFALLHLGGGPHDGFEEFDRTFWTRLGAQRVRVLPGGLSDANAWRTPVSDIGGVIEKLAPGTATLLLRPDRYVAAYIRPGEARDAQRQLEALMGCSEDQAESLEIT